MENSFVNIYAQRKDSSSPDLIWTNSKIDPIEMLCFENKIFILHKKGVVVIERIKDTQKSSTSDNNASQSNIYSESSINIQMNHVVEIPNHDLETKKSDIPTTHSEALIRKEPPKSEIDFSNNDDSPEETTITCPYCGMKQPKDGTKFCSDCGKLIENQSNDTGKLPKPKAESDKLQKLLEQFKQKN